MGALRIVELVLGWLSVLIGTAVLVFTYAGGYIAPIVCSGM
jgi:hypothetical protein